MSDTLMAVYHPANPTFTDQDWFAQMIPAWTELFKSFAGQPFHYLEVGVFEGRSLGWVMQNIATHPQCRAVAIDSFERHTEATLRQNLAIWGLTDKVLIKAGRSQDILRTLPANLFFMVYIDGGHRAAEVLEDLVLAWPLLCETGILICDDYWWAERDDPMLSPKWAIDTFVTMHRRELRPIYTGPQVIFQRVKPESIA